MAMNLLVDLQLNLGGRLSTRKNQLWEQFVLKTMQDIQSNLANDTVIERLLQTLLHFLNKYEGTSDTSIDRATSSYNYYVYSYTVEIRNLQTKEKRSFQVESNYTLGSLRRMIARAFSIPVKELILKTVGGKVLEIDNDDQPLRTWG